MASSRLTIPEVIYFLGGVRTNFFYADEGLIGEYDANGTELRTYGYEPDALWGTNPLFQKVGSGYAWYLNDHLGTPQKLVRADGTVVWSADYEAFGKATVTTGTITNNLRFPGQYYDQETGLHYNWNRYYDPQLGRHLSTDPIGVDGGDLNLYGYVLDLPNTLFDPWGLATLHYWPPGVSGSKNGWHGHVSITLDDGTYISYWPSRGVDWWEHAPPRSDSYRLDRRDERKDSVDVPISGLDEDKMKAWWGNGQHGDFSVFNNCSDIASEALRQGGLPVPYHLIYEPEQVYRDVAVPDGYSELPLP